MIESRKPLKSESEREKVKMYIHIKAAAKRHEGDSLKNNIAAVKTKTKKELLDSWYYRNLLTKKQQEQPEKEMKKLLIEKLKNESQHRLNNYFKKCDEIAAAPDVKDIVITVSWVKNQTWGLNPHAEIWAAGRFTTGRASGCGYDQLSAAIANALNQNYSILKLLYLKYNKILAKNKIIDLREAIGYGCGYNQKPYFDGGVGYSCFKNIFDELGARVNTWHETKTSDSMYISF